MTAQTLPNGVNATAVVAYAQRLQESAPEDGTRFGASVHWHGAMVEDGGYDSDATVEVAVDGSRFVGTVRTSLAPQDAATTVTRGREAVIRGVGDLRQVR